MTKRKSYFMVAALFHEVLPNNGGEQTTELVAPEIILAVSEELARLKLTQMFPQDAVGAKALENLDQVQLIVKRV